MKRLSTHPVLLAYRHALTQVIIITFIASLFIILRHPPITGLVTDGLFGAWASFSETYAPILDLGIMLTMGLIGVYALVAFIIQLAHTAKIPVYHPLISGIIVYLMVSVTLTPSETGWSLNPQYLGISGLFTAFVVGILTVGAHRLAHQLRIKVRVNASLSESLMQPLEAVMTTVVLVILAILSRWILGDAGLVFPQWLSQQLAGLLTLSASIWTVVLVILVARCLQFVGLDAQGWISLTLLPILVVGSAQNLDAFLYDKALPNILATGFLFFDTGVLPLLIALWVFGKDPDHRRAAKLGIVPAVFNLPETALVGLPLVFNGALLIPFLVTGITGVTISYTAMTLFWVNKPLMALSALVPSPLGVFASTLDWRALVLYSAILGLNVLIYWPFIRRMNRQSQASTPSSDANVLN
jgi:PTS system cellobiose-specific IIC component